MPLGAGRYIRVSFLQLLKKALLEPFLFAKRKPSGKEKAESKKTLGKRKSRK